MKELTFFWDRLENGDLRITDNSGGVRMANHHECQLILHIETVESKLGTAEEDLKIMDEAVRQQIEEYRAEVENSGRKDAIIQDLQSRLDAAEKFPNEWHNPSDLLEINTLQRRLGHYVEAQEIARSALVVGLDMLTKEHEATKAIMLVKVRQLVEAERRVHSAADLIGEALEREHDGQFCKLDVAAAAVWLANQETLVETRCSSSLEGWQCHLREGHEGAHHYQHPAVERQAPKFCSVCNYAVNPNCDRPDCPLRKPLVSD